MKTLFDATTVSFSHYEMLLLPGAALLVTVFIVLRDGARKWQFIMAGVTVLLLLLTFVLPLADHEHVQNAARSAGIKTVEGVISNHSRVTERRFTGTSRGVGVTTTHNYRTVTTESFHVGTVWFWFDVNGFPSSASFTNAGDPPLALKDGMRARVSYFEDGWYDGQRRIVKLALSDGGAARVAPARSLDPGFGAFWQRFSAAASKGDEAGVKALTRFPFLFAGTPLDAGRFDSIWMGIFPEPNRPCFAAATPVRDGDAMSVSCGVYVYVFEKGADGWKLASFTADPEAEM